MNAINSIKKVKLRRGTCRELAKIFGVSIRTVSLSASGINNSVLAQEIRKAAVELGGDAIIGEFQEKTEAMSSILAKQFGITTQTVRNALRGISNSELAQRIRNAAVELGGDAIYGSKKQIKI